ncbi:MAG: hypothetical protein WAK35_05550 [Xanthobacteraceae bacterium]
MPEPRRIFRIEKTAAARRVHPAPGASASSHGGEVMQALAALQALMAAAPASLATDAAAPCQAGAGHAAAPQADDMARVADELDAVSAGTAQATQKILAAAEEIDQLANNLSAALKGRLERELAQDIADSALRIFEACNFQDLIGQRVAKVMKTLKVDEALSAPATDAPDLHGPRLDHDKGHLSQRDIYLMFGS